MKTRTLVLVPFTGKECCHQCFFETEERRKSADGETGEDAESFDGCPHDPDGGLSCSGEYPGFFAIRDVDILEVAG